MKLADQIAVAVLAATDAVFIPDRDPMARPRHTVIYERRSEFPYRGVPWASEKVAPGLDDAGRKQVQRALEDLAARGLVETYQPRAGKTLGVKLTAAGDAYARAWAGLPQLTDGWPLLEQLAAPAGDRRARPFQGTLWTPETVLAGVRWGDNERRKAFVDVEEKLLPAIVRGWVHSNCSVRGHCWYTLTQAGAKAVERPAPEPARNLPAATNEGKRLYYTNIHLEIEALASAKPAVEREIGEIPLPVSF